MSGNASSGTERIEIEYYSLSTECHETGELVDLRVSSGTVHEIAVGRGDDVEWIDPGQVDSVHGRTQDTGGER